MRAQRREKKEQRLLDVPMVNDGKCFLDFQASRTRVNETKRGKAKRKKEALNQVQEGKREREREIEAKHVDGMLLTEQK